LTPGCKPIRAIIVRLPTAGSNSPTRAVMANTTINNVAVIEGRSSCRFIGVWIADLKIDRPDGAADAGTKVMTIRRYHPVSTVAPSRTGRLPRLGSCVRAFYSGGAASIINHRLPASATIILGLRPRCCQTPWRRLVADTICDSGCRVLSDRSPRG